MTAERFPTGGLILGGAVLMAVAGVLWVKFGALVYFDTIAARFIGCFI
jgi:hypothetical protein